MCERHRQLTTRLLDRTASSRASQSPARRVLSPPLQVLPFTPAPYHQPPVDSLVPSGGSRPDPINERQDSHAHSSSNMRLCSPAVAVALLGLLLLLLVTEHTSAYVYWRNATKRNSGSVVPLPKVINFKSDVEYLAVTPGGLTLKSLGAVERCLVVDLAKTRYLTKYLFDDVGPEPKDDSLFSQRRCVGQLNLVELVGAPNFKCELVPGPQMDEAYNLTYVAEPKAKLERRFTYRLEASSSWGFLRGLETLSQLVFNMKLPGTFAKEGFGIKLAQIQDEPRFAHRGFMLDTARHYISLDRIMELLDAMAFNKLNVFHWHMVDDQSWPYLSETYPQLASSSFRPHLVYSRKDVMAVIVYAAMRGIRVMPELDTPGHSYPLRHIPDTLSECYNPATGRPNGDFGPVDPTRDSAYYTVGKLLDEFAVVFDEPYFHAGGDEVDFDCWKSNERIQHWMAQKNITGNYEELSNMYMRRLYDMVRVNNKTMLVWQEVFDLGANLPRDVVIHVWKNINDKPGYLAELSRVVKAGYSALLSSCWYLNYIDYGQDWIKFYQCDPRQAPVPADRAHLVLGGEICQWTEFVDDTNVVSRTWPRASAAAERLWSPATANNTDEFLKRLEQHRCRLIRRGIQAEPINGPGYC